MARLELTEVARARLDELIQTHSLPADTRERVRDRLRRLNNFPRMGRRLHGAYEGYRFLLGPWNWMVIVYRWSEADDVVTVVTIVDARSSASPIQPD